VGAVVDEDGLEAVVRDEGGGGARDVDAAVGEELRGGSRRGRCRWGWGWGWGRGATFRCQEEACWSRRLGVAKLLVESCLPGPVP
jgi:hypothetical protein